MPRKIIKRYLPSPDSVKENKYLKPFGKRLHDPQLWHLTRFSVSHAFALGLFCAFIPVPFQMFIAAFGAILFRANIVISISLVWITNPLTIPLIFGGAYFIGLWILGMPINNLEFELSLAWFSNKEFLTPFMLGCLICSSLASILGYLFIRLFWRLNIVNAWERRKTLRKNKAASV